MTSSLSSISFSWRRMTAGTLIAAGLLAGCVTQQPSKVSEARRDLILARNHKQEPSIAAAYYLKAADEASRSDLTNSRRIYNDACAELTVLLRSSTSWNRTTVFSVPGGETFTLRYSPGAEDVWSPAYFDEFRTANSLDNKIASERKRIGDYGGMLAGIKKPADPRRLFYPKVGVTAPVTAVVNFSHATGKSSTATLTLYDPAKRDKVRIDGSNRALAADFTAPLAYYPDPKWLGLEAMLRPSCYGNETGIYMLQPYDPKRIPVLFVHGLMSTPQTWFKMINDIESDPQMRGRYQFWVFAYPTGDPIAYSALQLRKNMAKIYQTYPGTRNVMVVGHSLGGLLTQMQAVNTGRVLWDAVFTKDADELYAKIPANDVIKESLVFNANPRIERIVFISTPHYGSDLATGFIGRLGIDLIHLPVNLVKQTYSNLGDIASLVTQQYRLPDVVQGLSPKSPLLKALNTLKIQAPFYSIIGDGGVGHNPHGTDGVVPYWSAHLPGAQKEIIVPYGHCCLGEPLTIDAVMGIMRLNLKTGPAAAGK